MPDFTEHYDLPKGILSENYSLDMENEKMDKIDAALHGLQEGADGIEQDVDNIGTEIGDARQGEGSLVDNIQGIKDDLAEHKEEYAQQNLSDEMVIRELPNGVRDEFDYENGVFIKKISNEVMIDGNYVSNISAQYSDDFDRIEFNNTINDGGPFDSTRIDHNSMVRGYNQGTSNSDRWQVDEYYMLSSGAVRTIVEKNKFDTIQDAINYYNNNPLVLNYRLLEPIETPLPEPMTANAREIVRLSEQVGKLTNAVIQLGGEQHI